MKYLSYALDSGTVSLRDAPVPTPSARQVIVRLTHSVVSRGTEKMLLTFGRAGWLERARQHPERVQQVLDKVWTDGPMVARDALQDRLNRPMQLGYASAGVVHAVGVDVRNFEPGMRVACNGPHAEFVSVPQTFCARIPDGVSSEHAALTPIASVGLRALQLAQLDLGSHVAVIGLGMIGSLTAALASAQGARVLGVDPDAGARDRAASMGVFTTVPPEGAARVASARTARHGCDVVFVCTSGRDPAPLRSAVSLCRLGGRVVLVGASDVALDRDAMYAREISLMVSRSYGPGRQEEPYERGVDYPYAHVRWTAQRNFEAILELMARGRLDPAPLIARQAALEDAADVYATLGPGASVFVYPEAEELPEAPTILRRDSRPPASMELGVIGAGNYARRVFLPALRDAG
ncbi:MAG: zinc-binding alcohol dehydrogenase, partial [Myxococcota bacterium]